MGTESIPQLHVADEVLPNRVLWVKEPTIASSTACFKKIYSPFAEMFVQCCEICPNGVPIACISRDR